MTDNTPLITLALRNLDRKMIPHGVERFERWLQRARQYAQSELAAEAMPVYLAEAELAEKRLHVLAEKIGDSGNTIEMDSRSLLELIDEKPLAAAFRHVMEELYARTLLQTDLGTERSAAETNYRHELAGIQQTLIGEIKTLGQTLEIAIGTPMLKQLRDAALQNKDKAV